MRAIVTGQVGMDKKQYLEAVRDFAGQQAENLSIFHVGDMMYREAPDVRPGRILDLPLSRLNSLRRAGDQGHHLREPRHAPSAGEHPRHLPLAPRSLQRVRL
jgi:hypothetical protein